MPTFRVFTSLSGAPRMPNGFPRVTRDYVTLSNVIADSNLAIYSRHVAAHYAALDSLTPCEQFVFNTYLHNGISVFDLGVGGGRSTPYLSAFATRYVGLRTHCAVPDRVERDVIGLSVRLERASDRDYPWG